MKNQTRSLGFCFILIILYFFSTFETSVNDIMPVNDDETIHGLEQRRKFRKQLLLKSHSDEKTHRTPDAILIGAGKCGTSTLRDFMQLHPLVQCLSTEAKYFDHHLDEGIDYYKKLLPSVSRHDILMEKTPGYFSSSSPELPNIINNECPGVKIILILCNPVDRIFSRRIMQYIKLQPKKYNSKIKSVEANNLFEKYVEDELYPNLHQKGDKSSDDLYCPERYAGELYICRIGRWIKSFGRERILILNGEELLRNPGSVVNKVQDYLQIPRVLKKNDFVRNPVTGMFCVRPWWEENYNFKADKLKRGSWYENLICMWNGKGVTRSETSSFGMANSTRLKLQNLYKPYNEKLFKILNRTFNW